MGHHLWVLLDDCKVVALETRHPTRTHCVWTSLRNLAHTKTPLDTLCPFPLLQVACPIIITPTNEIVCQSTLSPPVLQRRVLDKRSMPGLTWVANPRG